METRDENFFESLAATRQSLARRFKFIQKLGIDDHVWEDLEEALITSDIGFDLTEELIKICREKIQREHFKDRESIVELVKSVLLDLSSVRPRIPKQGYPEIIFMVGVNGSGKTTTIAKLADKRKNEGAKVMLIAADTFRAAAVEQLRYWSELLGVDIVYNSNSNDPASVVYDGIQSALARDIDLVIIDTAGRLQTQTNLMNELNKIRSVIDRNSKEAMIDCLLVVDATTGQNGMSQAEKFIEAASVDAIIVTKIDGSSKGGIALAIQNRFDIPVRYLGVGETEHDLLDFDHQMFIDALFD
tara:strand:+ start:2520 stop:3422 length:903 start_codon:yes stop_codon:yes gene_type:complete